MGKSCSGFGFGFEFRIPYLSALLYSLTVLAFGITREQYHGQESVTLFIRQGEKTGQTKDPVAIFVRASVKAELYHRPGNKCL